ncbi:hypothetical protein O181_050823, partial [Austropuccinia psidii MF-1]|nr:hypothetical protein [Austropuccinia psidii MF-1]
MNHVCAVLILQYLIGRLFTLPTEFVNGELSLVEQADGLLTRPPARAGFEKTTSSDISQTSKISRLVLELADNQKLPELGSQIDTESNQNINQELKGEGLSPFENSVPKTIIDLSSDKTPALNNVPHTAELFPHRTDPELPKLGLAHDSIEKSTKQLPIKNSKVAFSQLTPQKSRDEIEVGNTKKKLDLFSNFDKPGTSAPVSPLKTEITQLTKLELVKEKVKQIENKIQTSFSPKSKFKIDPTTQVIETTKPGLKSAMKISNAFLRQSVQPGKYLESELGPESSNRGKTSEFFPTPKPSNHEAGENIPQDQGNELYHQKDSHLETDWRPHPVSQGESALENLAQTFSRQDILGQDALLESQEPPKLKAVEEKIDESRKRHATSKVVFKRLLTYVQHLLGGPIRFLGINKIGTDDPAKFAFESNAKDRLDSEPLTETQKLFEELQTSENADPKTSISSRPPKPQPSRLTLMVPPRQAQEKEVEPQSKQLAFTHPEVEQAKTHQHKKSVSFDQKQLLQHSEEKKKSFSTPTTPRASASLQESDDEQIGLAEGLRKSLSLSSVVENNVPQLKKGLRKSQSMGGGNRREKKKTVSFSDLQPPSASSRKYRDRVAPASPRARNHTPQEKFTFQRALSLDFWSSFRNKKPQPIITNPRFSRQENNPFFPKYFPLISPRQMNQSRKIYPADLVATESRIAFSKIAKSSKEQRLRNGILREKPLPH